MSPVSKSMMWQWLLPHLYNYYCINRPLALSVSFGVLSVFFGYGKVVLTKVYIERISMKSNNYSQRTLKCMQGSRLKIIQLVHLG